MEKTVEKILADKLGISEAEADRIWNATEESLIEAIKVDAELRLREFGTFNTHQRAAQQINHPVTGETYDVPPYKSLTFKASDKLLQAINEAHNPQNTEAEPEG